MSTHEPDHAGAREYRRQAEQHYQAADRFRVLGLREAQQAALEAARTADTTAELLEVGECGAMFRDPQGNACRCTRPAHPGLDGHRGVVVTEAAR